MVGVNNALLGYERLRKWTEKVESEIMDGTAYSYAAAAPEENRSFMLNYLLVAASLQDSFARKDWPIYTVAPMPMRAVEDSLGSLNPTLPVSVIRPPTPHGAMHFEAPVDTPLGPLDWALWSTESTYRLIDEGEIPEWNKDDPPAYGMWFFLKDMLCSWSVLPRDGQIGDVVSVMPQAGPANEWPNMAGRVIGLWLFMEQKIAPPYPRNVSRQLRRKVQRLTGKEPPPVNIVQLRAYERGVYDRAESEGREWSHSWIVRGHWRNQWYPKRRIHAPTWIAPYVKGSGPLLGGRKVFEVVR